METYGLRGKTTESFFEKTMFSDELCSKTQQKQKEHHRNNTKAQKHDLENLQK